MKVAHRSLFGVRSNFGPNGDAATDMLVQIGFGSALVGFEKAVNTVPGNEDRFHPRADGACQLAGKTNG